MRCFTGSSPPVRLSLACSSSLLSPRSLRLASHTLSLIWPPGTRQCCLQIRWEYSSLLTFHAAHWPSPPPDLFGSCLISVYKSSLASIARRACFRYSGVVLPSLRLSRSSGSVGFPFELGIMSMLRAILLLSKPLVFRTIQFFWENLRHELTASTCLSRARAAYIYMLSLSLELTDKDR